MYVHNQSTYMVTVVTTELICSMYITFIKSCVCRYGYMYAYIYVCMHALIEVHIHKWIFYACICT